MTIYERLEFPSAPEARPYTVLNMVATIDGKTVSGNREESVLDLGSKNDHLLMDRIESSVDAVLLGARTIRATPKSWNPKSRVRVAVTRSGNVDYEAQFLGAPGAEAYVACPDATRISPPPPIGVLRFGAASVDFPALLREMRTRMGIQRLLCLGGSETNAQLLTADLVDELFLTIAPKVKLGRDVPTYAGGEPLPKEQLQRYRLIEHHVVDDEVFLRYRRVVET